MQSSYSMKIRVYFILIGLLLINSLSLFSQQLNRSAYIEKYKDIAIKEMKAYGIPASITLAQGCLESGDGNSRLAREGNNHFGIKCHNNWAGDKMYHDDDEKGECFRVYKDAKQSFEDHSDFLRYRSRYASLFDLDPKDYKGWAHGLKKAGYATNPKYAEHLINIIEEYELYKYDSELAPSQVASEVPRPSEVKLVDIDKFVVRLGREVYKRNGVDYVVAKRYDTYYRIADEFDLTPEQIMEYNDLGEKDNIFEGEVVYIEPKRRKADKYHPVHIAEKGETMRSIAQLYGVKMKELYKKNQMDMEEGEQPAEGQEIYLRKVMKK